MSSIQAYVSSLATNTSALLSLAYRDLPAFGVDPTTIRSIALNSSSAAWGSTYYIVSVQYTVVLGSSASFHMPSSTSAGGVGRRRRRALQQDDLSSPSQNDNTCSVGDAIKADCEVLPVGVDLRPNLPAQLKLKLVLGILSLLARTVRDSVGPAERLAEDLILNPRLIETHSSDVSHDWSYMNTPTFHLVMAKAFGRKLLDGSSLSSCGPWPPLVTPDPSTSNITLISIPQVSCQTPGITEESLLLSSIMGTITANIEASAAIQVGDLAVALPADKFVTVCDGASIFSGCLCPSYLMPCRS